MEREAGASPAAVQLEPGGTSGEKLHTMLKIGLNNPGEYFIHGFIQEAAAWWLFHILTLQEFPSLRCTPELSLRYDYTQRNCSAVILILF